MEVWYNRMWTEVCLLECCWINYEENGWNLRWNGSDDSTAKQAPECSVAAEEENDRNVPGKETWRK